MECRRGEGGSELSFFYSTALSTQAFMQPWPVGAVLLSPSLSAAGPSSKEKQYLGKKEEGIGAKPMQCCAVEL